MLTDDHAREIAAASKQSRAAIDRAGVDDAWHAALAAHRGDDTAAVTGEPCAFDPWIGERLDEPAIAWPLHGVARLRAPVGYAIVATGEAMPPRSPHTVDAILALDRVDGELQLGALDARAGELLDRAQLDSVDKLDLVIELDREHHRARSWLYDHGLDRIACTGMSDAGGDREELLRLALASLHGVAGPDEAKIDLELVPDTLGAP
jgi:hypothetical protein